MVYVQYFQKSAISNDLVSACGDRSVVILDGRNNLETMQNDARQFNGYRRPHYPAFQIMRGESFSRSSPITSIILD